MEINKYQQGQIYKIVDNAYTKTYYGSTTSRLSARMAQHRSQYNAFKNGKRYKYMCFDLFDEFGFENCKIELVELYPCNSKNELEQREGYYIQNNTCSNKNITGRTNEKKEQVNCQLCNKQFSSVSNLNKHRRISKCSNAKQCETCHMYYVNKDKHLPDCIVYLKMRNTELEKKIAELEMMNCYIIEE
jgi:hypothetical protein